MTSETSDQADDATPRRDEPSPTVLQTLGERTGLAPKVLLRDEESHAGNSPVIDASARVGLQPAGRSQYQVLGQIAKGGMGVVLKSHDTDLGRDVAMKVLLDQHADKPEILQRFVEEAQIGGQLQHPGIVPVYELGLMADERPFFTMKLVKGRTLAALLADRRGDPGERRRFLTVFEQICQTMAYAHSRKVIHRDLKPANIMVGAFGEVQVVDWGLAKVLSEGGVADERAAAPERTEVSIIETLRSTGSSAGTESLAGSVMGTPAYMPPEQARGDIERVDERADVFGLGAILCEILTGRAPYVGEHDKVVVEAARALQDGAHERLAACGADPALKDLVERCLAPNREVRPRHAGMLVEELGGFLAEQEQRARDAELAEARAVHERKARRLTLTLAVTIVGALLVGGFAWQWHSRGVAERRGVLAREVDGLLAEAQLLRGRTDYADALDVVDRAEVLVSASADADAAVRALVGSRAEQLRQEFAGASAEAERQQRKQQLLDEIEARASDSVFTGGAQSPGAVAGYAAAFAEFGFSPSDDLSEGVQRLRELENDELIGQALDDWSRHLLEIAGIGGDYPRLVEAAMRVDPDPARSEVRRALLANDRRTLERLAASPEAYQDWSPTTLLTFVVPLRLRGHRIEVRPLMRAVHARFPTDARLNLVMARYAMMSSMGDPEPLHALYHASAAYAARPHDPAAGILHARALALNGLNDQAIAGMLRAVDEHPQNDFIQGGGAAGWVLGFMENATLGVGQVGLFELRARQRPDDDNNLNSWAWTLLNAPDAGPADHRKALDLAVESIQIAGETADAAWNTLAAAAWLAGDMLTTRDAARESIRLYGGEFAMDYGMLALALDALGQPDEAQQALRAMATAPTGLTEPIELRLGAAVREVFGDDAF